MEKLNDFEKDSLGELINMAMGRAASNLNEISGSQVKMTVPNVSLVSLEEYREMMANSEEVANDSELISVSEQFTGGFSGNAVLIFHFNNSLDLVKCLLQDVNDLQPDDFSDMEEEVLTEVGNILLNSCVATFANVLHKEIHTEIPKFNRGPLEFIIDKQLDYDEDAQVILLAEIGFSVESKEISGNMVLTLTLPVLRSILEELYTVTGVAV